ncbi:MAG: hypothetical protein H2061_00755 [Burkholderiales bacterium]|nr:hypothetical protein [Burkholderiales bacterium]OUT79338.1 MAG: hypothetical protein CBB82_01935 [Betaproteobacteria bacterium TMED22]
MEFLVIITAAIIGWVFADQFNKVNLSKDKLFDQFIESKFLSDNYWQSLMFLATSWLGVLLVLWVVKQLIFQNSPPLVLCLDIIVLALMLNIFDVRDISADTGAIRNARQKNIAAGVATLFSVTASRIFSLIFWYWITPGLSGAILFFILLSMFNALIRSNALKVLERNQFIVRGYSVLIWLPHKILIITYAFVGDFEAALRCWRAQGRQSGLGFWAELLSTSAGALNIQLGGGESEDIGKSHKPVFGLLGHLVTQETIPRSVAFFIRNFLLWVLVFFLLNLMLKG